MSSAFKLVVVDDEEAIQFIYESQLEEEIDEGLVDFVYFSRAQQAMDYLEKRGNDTEVLILVSDINMPGMDGVTMAEFISPKYPNIDIYLSSAYNQKDNLERIKKCNVQGYFQKPVNFDEIKKVIRAKESKRKTSAA